MHESTTEHFKLSILLPFQGVLIAASLFTAVCFDISIKVTLKIKGPLMQAYLGGAVKILVGLAYLRSSDITPMSGVILTLTVATTVDVHCSYYSHA